jgi:phosphofructokinase-like protein
VKRIGILTCGGDCAGLNTAIRSVTQCAILKHGWEVYGIRNGTVGLLTDPPLVEKLDVNFNGIGHALLRMGGTILGSTSKGNPFSYKKEDGTIGDCSNRAIETYHKLGLDALIAIGGDGGLKIMSQLAEQGNINLVGIPKTIDNDVNHTESLGFSTAVEVATYALDGLQPTAASHDRVMVLEVMGRDAGHIALNAGIAGGADVILIPEIPFSVQSIVQKIQSVIENGRNFALVVVAESARMAEQDPLMVRYQDGAERYGGMGDFISRQIAEAINVETRTTVLGHVQRGGQPIARDRIMAAAFGVRAVSLVAEEQYGRMVAWQNQRVTDISLSEALGSYQSVDLNGSLIATAKGLGISLGNE